MSAIPRISDITRTSRDFREGPQPDSCTALTVSLFDCGGLLAWAVYMPTQGPPQGSLTGTYGGASGDIAAGVGVGANVLWGGSGRSVMLQPISVEGSAGIDVTLGVSALTLQWMP